MSQADAQTTLDGIYGRPVTITSGLRTPAHNAAVGGVPNSDHLNPDGAFDFVVPGMSTADAAAKLKASGVGARVILDENNHVHWSTGGSVTPADDAMPSPDQVMKGYGAAAAAGGAPGPAASAATSADPDAMPDPRDVLGGYKSQAPGSGAVTSGADRKPVNAAQEATFQRLAAAGKIDTSAAVGSDALPWPERPDIPTPPGAAHIDPFGNFVPAAAAKPAAPSPAPEVPAGQGNPASNFVGDWAARAAEGNAAIHQGFDAAAHPTAGDQIVHAAGLPTLNDVKTAGGVMGVASAPFMSAFDQVVGRPLGAIANTINAVTGLAPGYQADPRKISDVASAVAPFGEAALANRAIATGAKAAGMTESAYVAARAADAAAAPAIARFNAPPKSVTSTNPVVNAITGQIAPFAAAASKGSAEKQAGQVIASKASDLPAVRSVLGDGPTEIVPGSKPTTFQATGDMGLGAFERGVAAKNPEPFKTRAAEQSNARTAALGSIQSGGDPVDVAKHVQTIFDQIDADTQAHVDAAAAKADTHVATTDATTQAALDKAHASGAQSVAGTDTATQGAVDAQTAAARQATDATGGTGTPEAYGASVRDNLLQAQAASKARYGALYDAVDPEGVLVANVKPVRQVAAQITDAIPPTAKGLEGEEADVFRAAAAMPPTVPASHLLALRVRASQAASQARLAGDNVSAARLTKLQSSIDDTLAGTISEKAVADQAQVAAGKMAPVDAVGAKMQAVLDGWEQQRIATQARTGAGGENPSGAGSGAAGVSRVGGANVPASGGPGGAAGGQSLPGEPVHVPLFDAAAADRLKTANTAFAEHARSFGLQPISQTLANKGYAGDYRVLDGQVPGKFFKSGNGAFEGMQGLLKVSPDSLPVIEDYAASDLRRYAGNPDGTIDPAKFDRWTKINAGALRALPSETQARFANAAEAGRAVGEATTNRAAALKQANAQAAAEVIQATAARNASLKVATTEAAAMKKAADQTRAAALGQAQAGAPGKILGLSEPDDVTRTVGRVLAGRTSVADMGALADAVAANPDAKAGLRQAVADHLTSRLMANTEAGTTGQPTLKADAFQSYIRQNRTALGKVFTPDEISTLDAIGADIRQARRSQDALKLPGANTVQDVHASGLVGSMGGKVAHSMLTILGAALGGHEGGGAGAIGGVAFSEGAQALRSYGINRVDDLVTKAMLDPEVARRLLAKVPTDGAGQIAPKVLKVRMSGLLGALGANSGAVSQAEQPVPERHYNAFTPSAAAPVVVGAPNAVSDSH